MSTGPTHKPRVIPIREYTLGMLYSRYAILSVYYTLGMLYSRDTILSGYYTLGILYSRHTILSVCYTLGILLEYTLCILHGSREA